MYPPVFLSFCVSVVCQSRQITASPNGTYTGVQDVLGETVGMVVTVTGKSTMDFELTGPFPIFCKVYIESVCGCVLECVCGCSQLQGKICHSNTLQHTATHCNTLRHNATQCNTATHSTTLRQGLRLWHVFLYVCSV